jgi:hypothetical protein
MFRIRPPNLWRTLWRERFVFGRQRMNARLQAWIEVLNGGIEFKDADDLRNKLIEQGISPALFERSKVSGRGAP